MTRRNRWWVLAVVLLAVPALVWGQGSARVVHRVKSAYSEITVIDTPNGFRQMIFDAKFDGRDAIQSEMKKSMPNELTLAYSKHMMTALPLVEKKDKDERILVIGLGGACMQRYLYELLPKATIETAELDPVVLDVAKNFFALTLDARQKVSVGDGRKFIEESKEKYDLIMLDAFSATSIPYALATKEFLEACKAHLNEGGVVCANVWSTLPEYPDMLKTYDAVFAEWRVLRCGAGSSNMIVVALPTKRGLAAEKWAAMCRAYEKSHGMMLPLGRMVEDGLQADVKPGTKVLVDGAEGK
jgi:spermidine synthase